MADKSVETADVHRCSEIKVLGIALYLEGIVLAADYYMVILTDAVRVRKIVGKNDLVVFQVFEFSRKCIEICRQ